MKLLVFSDTHLNSKFHQGKFDLLAKIIKDADQVIINGDFWDGYLTTFEDFVSSDWQKLFPLLYEKKAIYIYGNHDRETFADSRVDWFSTEQHHEYRTEIGGRKYYFTHGNRQSPEIDELFPIIFQKRAWSKLGEKLDQAGFIVFGRLYGLVFKRVNNKQKSWGAKNLPKDEIMVFGHSHYPEITNNYLNDGAVRGGLASYLLITPEKNELLYDSY